MIKDTHELQGFNTIKFPKLKGHIKLTLKNAKTKKVERVVEGDNIVTNAVSDIMGANYLGGIDYSKIFGDEGIWKTWFGGVLCFEDEHTNLLATDYYPYDSNTNALIAHAGQTPIDASHDDDTKRGNPTTNAYVFDETSAKIVWEWGTTHGNGVISALSLTHTDTGSYGLGSDTYDFKNNFEPFAVLNQSTTFWNSVSLTDRDAKAPMAMYDDSHCLSFFCKEGTTDTVTVHICKLAYLKSGIHQTLTPTNNQEITFDIQTPFTFYNTVTQYSPYYYFEPSTKYLWLFDNRTGANTWDNDDIKYCKIDTVNKTLVDFGSGTYYKTIHSNTGGIAPLGMCVLQGGGEFTSVHKIGNYLYFPTATNPVWSGYSNQRGTFVTGFIGIEINSSGEATGTEIVIPFNETQQHPQALTGQGIIISNGRVLNYHTGYTCKMNYTVGDTYRTMFLSSPQNPSTYAIAQKGGGGTTENRPQYILANKMLLTTKYNLPTAVTKTPSQSMTVEYTISEQAPST